MCNSLLQHSSEETSQPFGETVLDLTGLGFELKTFRADGDVFTTALTERLSYQLKLKFETLFAVCGIFLKLQFSWPAVLLASIRFIFTGLQALRSLLI